MTGSAYLALKLVHIVSSSVYLAMFVLGPALKIASDRAREPRVAAFVQDLIWRTGPWVIGVSGFLVFASGYAMVRGFLGKIAENPFSLWGLIVLFLSLAVWYFGMRPLEAKLANLADQAREEGAEATSTAGASASTPESESETPGKTIDAPRSSAQASEDYRSASGSWLIANTVVLVLIGVAYWLMVFKPTG